ncbi:PqiC family protein [Geomonas sp. Red69]|uniref:PqiC family protein n=1 Tax=Geomonas diazotrophica TaxID=2843197 RepID=A0ABX8JNT0_9BACT|nr:MULTISPECIES: PqiC family protein [Geomonas]MBU5638955.1 PqiC family protein [Geomonas diazotrophica]QWV99242.1 PqiC family protein [Geomonas nitrogeniifigens]QXE88411.1 PqiC family protein [Geomonas nitrogeniifigens]
MRRTTAALGIIAATLLCSACSRSPRVTYYTLTPAPSAGAVQQSFSSSVAVGPVTIPELVNRPQLVVRLTPSRVAVLEEHRWAEPLKNEIPRLLAQDLGPLLGSNRVFTYDQGSGAAAQYRVLVDIVRLEAVPGDSVTVEAGWVVRGAGSARREGRAVIKEKADGSDYDAVAAALSRALAGVSAEVAKSVRSEAFGRK